MPEINLKSTVISSLIWKLMERGGVVAIQIVIQIILARLLLPEDYGIIALITVFILISRLFVSSGLGTALIQKKDITETDYSSILYLTLFISLIMYVILFFLSPFISLFYNQPLITPILRILGLTLFLGAIISVQNAIIVRNFKFKLLFVSNLGAIIISGIVGIIMAYLDYGVWALVTQQIISLLTVSIILWLTVKWR
ncbi:MAG: oligosaccharide flippase family protein, partial [Dysgonamonadaceae bacterium]|nr:oligosaccharide flippase family protein [Dysgonamonadaceae bacterium]